jgi:hypothetical protein
MHSSSDKNQNYKALATKVCDEEHLVYLHYCRFWDVNVRDKLIIVSHKYFKWFHVAEEKKIMAAATNRHTHLQHNNLHSKLKTYVRMTSEVYCSFIKTLFMTCMFCLAHDSNAGISITYVNTREHSTKMDL